MNKSSSNQDIKKRKKLLRKQYLHQRTELSISQWQTKSKHICQHLTDSKIVNQAKVILSYLSFKQEPDLSLLHQQKQFIWGLPRCQGKELIWHQYQWGDKLFTGAYGIAEPGSDFPLIYASEVDLILVPAVACDRFGNRLGYGGGYYDRLLSQKKWQNIPTVGIIFNFAYVAQLEKELWDQPLNYICTEQGIEKIKSVEEQN